MAVPARKAEAAAGLRLAGASYDEIATALGYTDAAAAQKSVEVALARMVSPEDRASMRALASARYERLLRAVWGKAIDTENAEQLAAVRTARELMDRLVVLHGTAVPQQVQIMNPTMAALDEWVGRMVQSGEPEVIEADVLEIEGETGEAEAS